MAPTYLERCVDVLESDPRAALAHTRVELIDASGDSLGVYEGPVARREDERSWIRFHDAALWSGRNHLIFGVMHRQLLDRIPPYGSHGNADGVLLARLSLLGSFVTVDEPLQRMRVHEQQASTKYGVERGGVDYRAWRQWIDASGGPERRKIELPYWRIWAEHARSVAAVEGVPLYDRIRCLPTIPAWAWSRKGRMRKDLSTLVRPTAANAS